MLNLYRRHQPPCRYASRRYRNCTCPIWVQGSLRGEYLRRALDLRSWSAATDLVRDWEAAGEIGVVKKPDIPTISEAVDLFLADARAQQLSGETIRKYEKRQLRDQESRTTPGALPVLHARRLDRQKPSPSRQGAQGD